MKLHFLAAGRVRMNKRVFVKDADRAETIELPVSSALIRHPQGNVLFDTGCHPAAADDPEGRWGPLARVMRPLMTAQETLVPSLREVGLNPADIDVVVNSHLHTDHCGCNAFFHTASVLVHAEELAAARAPDAEAMGYLRKDWDTGRPATTVAGGFDLFGDGRIVLVHLPGHTPGMLGALVALDRAGTFLLASDAVSLRTNLDTDTAPRNTWNAAALFSSFAEIRRIETAGARIVCGHDDDQWQTLRHGGAGYD